MTYLPVTMNIRTLLIALCSIGLSLALLTGCDDSSDSSTPDATDPTVEMPSEETDSSVADDASDSDTTDPAGQEARLISQNGIGVAKLGMTFSDLKQALGENVEYTVESPFIVDFDAIAVRQNGEVQFYILYFSSETFEDDSIVQGLLTTASTFRTAEGIGPGTPISEAETAYGNAILAYNLANESREYVRFEDFAANNVLFGTRGGGSPADDYAGIYPSSTAEYNETEEFVEGAAIQAVLVTCLSESCN